MAQNLDEIINEMDAQALKYQELSEFRDNSKMSFFRYLKLIVAMLVKDVQLGFEKHQAEVNMLIENQEAGQKPWWERMILKFQFGDSVDVVNNVPTYFNVNQEKRIIRHVAISVSDVGAISIKAYKENGGQLNEIELAALSAYVAKIKPLGTSVNILSMPADRVKFIIDIELDKELFNTTGLRIVDSSSIIMDTMDLYLSNLPMGILFNSHLAEKLQSIEGVKDIWIRSSQVYGDTQFTEFNRKLKSDSGRVILDENSIINYVFD